MSEKKQRSLRQRIKKVNPGGAAMITLDMTNIFHTVEEIYDLMYARTQNPGEAMFILTYTMLLINGMVVEKRKLPEFKPQFVANKMNAILEHLGTQVKH